MVFFGPEDGIGGEKIAYFIAPIVENEGTPVGVCTLSGVGVFVKC